MSYRNIVAMTSASMVALIVAASCAFADEPVPFCRDYARTAVEQSRAARASGRCMHFVREHPARYQLDFEGHFRWCLSVFGSGDNIREREARDRELAICLH